MKVPLLSKLFGGMSDISTGVKQSQKFHKGKALLIMKNYTCYLIQGVISDDLLFFTPIGINRKYKIKGVYNLYPKNEKFFIILDEGVDTIDIDKIPKVIKFFRPKKEISIKNNELIETLSMEDYSIKGADELSSMAFLVAKTTALKHMEEPSKREILLIAIICIVSGILLGIIGAFTFLADSGGTP